MKILFIYPIIAVIALTYFTRSVFDFEEKQQEALTLSPNVPHDVSVADPTMTDLATFAWNEFFALNWKSNFQNSNLRGEADTNWSIAQSKYAPELSVWETYAHKNELVPVSGFPLKNIMNSKPKYSYGTGPDNILKIDNNNIQWSNYWNNLDEDNEIGSCFLYKIDGSSDESEEILYMAKVNFDEYDYFKSFSNAQAVHDAIQSSVDYYRDLKNNYDHFDTSQYANRFKLPAGSINGKEGAIEIKTAWKKVRNENQENANFITKQAVYYSYDNGKYTLQTGTFALIGMHIIHKTEQFPSFVFASFEHISVRNENYQFLGSDAPLVNGLVKPYTDDTKFTEVLPRAHAIPTEIASVNKQAQMLIKSQNTNSVWQNYQLIGVQAVPIDYKNRNQDQNYFMANYVIESDSLLTYFHGSFEQPFNSALKNVSFKGNFYNMGGCQGCHGQAQVSFGGDFSFLAGTQPTSTPDYKMTMQQALDSARTERKSDAKGINNFIKITAADNQLILIAVDENSSNSYQICNILSGFYHKVNVTINLQKGAYNAPIYYNGVNQDLKETATLNLPAGRYHLIYNGINWGGPFNYNFTLNEVEEQLSDPSSNASFGVTWYNQDKNITFDIK